MTYVGERGGKFQVMLEKNADIDATKAIFAGKFRRYHGESWLRRLADVPTLLKNIRDGVFLLLGTIESIIFIGRLKPDVILLKGGFVGVPIGLAAALWRIPFITHDSDAVPGLANRIVARWAHFHATALPADEYPYPKDRVKHVGILVGSDYQPVNAETQRAYKHAIGVPIDAPLVLITGGSSGAVALNRAIKTLLPKLLDDYPKLHVVHQVGKGKTRLYNDYSHARLQVAELLFPLYEYTGASDLVVTRAGANALAELGVQGRACIVVPSPHLTGGHQLKNAAALEKQGVAVVVQESTFKPVPAELDTQIRNLLDNASEAAALGTKLQAATITDATEKLTSLLIEVAKNQGKT